MTEIRSKCEGCGMCCRAILLQSAPHSHFPESITDNRGKDRIIYENKVEGNMDDATFVIENWYPITKDEVIKRNPFMLIELKRIYERHEYLRTVKLEEFMDKYLSNHFYGCNQLDEKTGRCMTHDNLPRVCSRYPYYDHETITEDNTLFYTEDCYYRRELQTE